MLVFVLVKLIFILLFSFAFFAAYVKVNHVKFILREAADAVVITASGKNRKKNSVDKLFNRISNHRISNIDIDFENILLEINTYFRKCLLKSYLIYLK